MELRHEQERQSLMTDPSISPADLPGRLNDAFQRHMSETQQFGAQFGGASDKIKEKVADETGRLRLRMFQRHEVDAAKAAGASAEDSDLKNFNNNTALLGTNGTAPGDLDNALAANDRARAARLAMPGLSPHDRQMIGERYDRYGEAYVKSGMETLLQKDPSRLPEFMDRWQGNISPQMRTEFENRARAQQEKVDKEKAEGAVQDITNQWLGNAPATPRPAPAPTGKSSSRGVDLSRYATGNAVPGGPSGIDGIHPEFASRIQSMVNDMPPDIRSKFTIISGFRSPEREAQVYREQHPDQTPPKDSYHSHGMAADLGKDPDVLRWVNQNGDKYGVGFTIGNLPGEENHLEPTEAGERIPLGQVASWSNEKQPRYGSTNPQAGQPRDLGRDGWYNNPGNIRLGGGDWVGRGQPYGAGSSGQFETFETPELGVRATVKNIQAKLGRGQDTPWQLAHILGPANDNNNPSWLADQYANALGIGVNDKIPNTPEAFSKLIPAITSIEKNYEAQERYQSDPGIYQRGITMAFSDAGLEGRGASSGGPDQPAPGAGGDTRQASPKAQGAIDALGAASGVGQTQPGHLAPFPSLEDGINQFLANPNLTPAQKKIAIGRLKEELSTIREVTEENRRSMGIEITGGLEKLRNGQPYEYNEEKIRHFFPPKDSNVLISKLNDAKEIGTMTTGLRNIPMQDAQARLGELEQSLPNTDASDYEERAKGVNHYRMALNQHMHALLGVQLDALGNVKPGAPTEKITDPAQYLIQIDPRLKGFWDKMQTNDPQHAFSDPVANQDYVNAMLARQEKLGVPLEKQHVLPSGVAQGIVRDIARDPANAPAMIAKITQQFGPDHTDAVMADLTQLGGMSGQYQVLGAIGNEKDRELLSRGITTQTLSGKDHETYWRDFIGPQDFTKVQGDVRSDPEMVKFRKSMLDSKSSRTQVDALQKGIDTLTYSNMVFNGMTETEAKEAALNSTARQYNYMEGGARVPKKLFDTVYYNAADTLRNLKLDDIMVPPGFGGVGQPTAQRYLDSQVRARPHWVTNEKESAIYLQDNEQRFVKDKLGNPIMVRFNEPARFPENPMSDYRAYESGSGL